MPPSATPCPSMDTVHTTRPQPNPSRDTETHTQGCAPILQESTRRRKLPPKSYIIYQTSNKNVRQRAGRLWPQAKSSSAPSASSSSTSPSSYGESLATLGRDFAVEPVDAGVTLSLPFFGFFGFFGKVAALLGPLIYGIMTVMFDSRVVRSPFLFVNLSHF